MPKNRKYFRHNDCILATSRTEEGLPFVASLVMNLLIWGILAKARSMYQIKVCHALFMANHFHMLLVVDNPEHVSEFIRYVKCETAHAVNRLLGRRRKTVWLEGSDTPILLTADDVIRYIVYIYLNPVKANLVERIEDYPGVSTWKMFFTGRTKKSCKKIPRAAIKQLPFAALNIREQELLQREYLDVACKSFEFILEPYAWLESFPELQGMDLEQIRDEIINRVKEEERECAAKRQSEQKFVAGPSALRKQSMLKEHTPKKHSMRMICISSDIGLRKQFISTYRSLCKIAEEVYRCWKLGELKWQIPPGFVSPKLPTLVSAIT